MVFGLFSTPKDKYEKKIAKLIQNSFPIYQKLPSTDIAVVLDEAAKFKNEEIKNLSKERKQEHLVWTDPFKVKDEQLILEYITEWHYDMQKSAGIPGRAPAIGLYMMSLSCVLYKDYKRVVKIVWKEVSRSYPYCSVFKVKKDKPKGF